MGLRNLGNWKQIFRNENGFISFLFGWALVTIIFLAALLFQFLSFSTPDGIKHLKGQGTEQTYDSPYDEVFQATVYLVNERGLTIIESSEKGGYIIAAEGSEFFYEGRIIALFFTPEPSKNHTQVEVISKFTDLPPLRELILKELISPRNRPSQILNDLGESLEDSNGKK